LSVSKEKIMVAYIPNLEDEWKFLCRKSNNSKKYMVIFNYNGDEFVGVEVDNEQYKFRDATQDDLDKALISKL